MSLNKETKLGLTYSQILATVTILLIFLGGYVDVKMDIAKLQTEKDNQAVFNQRLLESINGLNKKIDENQKETIKYILLGKQ